MSKSTLLFLPGQDDLEKIIGVQLQKNLSSECNVDITHVEDRCYDLLLVLFGDACNQLTGLELVKKYRNQFKDYNTPVLFLLITPFIFPHIIDPTANYDPNINELLGNPKFGSTDKAVLFAEILYEEMSREKPKLLNFVVLEFVADFKSKLLEKIALIIKAKSRFTLPSKNLLKNYYETFINYYDGTEDTISDDDLQKASRYYCSHNGIDPNNTHSVEKEIFRAPLPFILSDLLSEIEELRSTVGQFKQKIKLLLIDNNPAGKLGKINDIIDNYNLSDFLVLKPHEIKDITDTVLENVYEEIKQHQIILLDFFLNTANTYLAFNLIKKMVEIRNVSGKTKDELDSATVWYFITSAVHDSVTKYTQSGLLTEYYESMVVDHGDDPCNEKRELIFLYKLVSYINSQIRTYRKYVEKLDLMMICKEVKCTPHSNCLNASQGGIKKYLAEYENIKRIFYNEIAWDKYKELAERIDETVRAFKILPEADWQIMQIQIEYIDVLLDRISGSRFCCSYMKDEIARRSQIY